MKEEKRRLMVLHEQSLGQARSSPDRLSDPSADHIARKKNVPNAKNQDLVYKLNFSGVTRPTGQSKCDVHIQQEIGGQV